MATRDEMDATYNYMDEIFRLSLGETADITCALYDGDYSKTLEQAQADKHRYVLDSIGFKPGSRLIDIGCGWGPILRAARDRGGSGVGVTLSRKHAESCRKNGLEAYVMDWQDITVETFGKFDGVVSIGAFEHFATPEDYRAGRQDAVYDRFFRLCHDLVSGEGGRLYLQTMIWGPNFPGVDAVTLDAPKGSDAYILAVLGKFYPGSYLPHSMESLARVAQPYFDLVDYKDGRKDYIKTTEEWGVVWKMTPRKLLAALKVLPYFVRDRDFRYRIETLRGGYMKECMKREIMSHRRLVFQSRVKSEVGVPAGAATGKPEAAS
jgi:cyclopropane-fatty-acyl-phospholipid synthase